ncbi:DUF1684 domain-containing protein [Deinococcus psychrotolerans]|uniref:DUF1684 domain-containing protein n=1 Tax=Deinococcus psychrotolerans TaxID=2489213 RepID=A0A3G8YHP9_9DEIO|nr:DUF1684 domain-containing protein [Deinococcus psychrotolerans]AZI42004.1 DUF1684 domain-containing protein [Deinococcus psychrotolerans]
MSAWLDDLLSFRARKDAHFASGRGPLPKDGNFDGLTYFAPDPTWNLSLEVQRLPAEAAELATTTQGEVQRFVTWGEVGLPNGERLTLYAREGDDAPATLFVPFRDATSGKATYGAGRYLDAPLLGHQVTLDFNRAYHPFCAYSEAWTCPLPPAANWLRGAVQAGEKLASESAY